MGLSLGINGTVLSEQPSGVGIFCRNIIACLCSIVNDVTVWVNNQDVIDVNSNAKIIIAAKYFPFFIRNNIIFRAIWDQFFFPFLVKKRHINVIFFPVQEGIMFPRMPQVVFLHDMAPVTFPQGVPIYRRISYYVRVKLVLRNSAAIAVPSKFIKNEILHFVNVDINKVYVVGEGYDSNHFIPVDNPYRIVPEKYFLYIGNIVKNKNIERVIESFFSICPENNCKLIIAGKKINKKYFSDIEKIIDNNSFKNRVLILGYVDYNFLPHLYSAAEALLFPSLYEGFGLPILESMACGTPVITSNCTATAEVASDAALLVDPYSVESIKEAMVTVLHCPKNTDKLRRAGFERVKQFSWQSTAVRLNGIFRDVVKL